MPAPFSYIRDRLLGLSIRYRLMIYLLVGLIPILAVSFYFAAQVSRTSKNQIMLGHMAAAQATAGSVRQFVQGVVEAHDVISATIARSYHTPEEIQSYLEVVQHEIPLLETIDYAPPDGKVIAGIPPIVIGENLADRPYFQDLGAGRHWVVSPLLMTKGTRLPAFIIAHRVERDDQFAGVLVSAISPMALEGFVTARAEPDVGYGILDSRGHIVVSTILPKKLAEAHTDRSGLPSVREALKGRRSFAEPFVDPADGVRRLGASIPVAEIGWVVNVFEPVSTATAPIRHATLVNLLLLVLLTAGLVILLWLVGASLGKPITLLSRKAQAVAQGDFSQRMDTYDRAELGALAESFNDMAADLERATTEQRKAWERAMFLADIGELLSSTLDPKEAFQMVARKTADVVGDMVVIYELGSDGRLAPVAAYTHDKALLTQLCKLLEERPLRVGMGITGRAITEDRTLYVPRLSDLEDSDIRCRLQQLHAVSTIAVPMKVHGEITGALSVSSTTSRIDEEVVPIVEELARRLGIALENIRLYAEALEREESQRALTEVAGAVSSTLETEVVLETICSRALKHLAVDGVYIWVLQEEEHRLHGTAACGFRANEFVGLTLDLSARERGAVQALESGKAFYRHNVTPEMRPDPDQKFEAMSDLFQPLVSRGAPLGVMMVTDIQDPERFDDHTLAVMGLLAGFAATALANARAYERERRVAETLQRSLLAEIPEVMDHFELAHFYAPARQEAAIGGDFYDYIKVGDGRYGLVIGDVSGKGLEAAVVTAMAKYVLRAYAAEDPEPVSVLAKANNAVAKYTGAELFITLIYGLLNTRTKRFKYASAGHEPVLIYRSRDRKVEVGTAVGMAAGVALAQEYMTSECTLSEGDVLVLYTDGLTDARSPDGEFLGIEGLSSMMSELGELSADEFLEALMDRVRTYTGGEFGDDVAVLVVRPAPSGKP